jgi:hypothetical protein
VRQRGAVEVETALALEVLRCDPAVVLADELLRLLGVRLGQMLAKPGANAVYQSLIERVSASLSLACRSIIVSRGWLSAKISSSPTR